MLLTTTPISEWRITEKYFNGECRFKNYWMETGGASTLAVELAREYNLETIILDNVQLDVNSISSFDYLLLARKELSQFQILALIYFTGYLTIKEGNMNVLTLTFPNTEVKTTFTQFLVQKYSGIVVGFFVNEAEKALRSHDLDWLVKVLNAYYIEHPYTLLEKEKGYQLAFYSFFVMMGGSSNACGGDHAPGTQRCRTRDEERCICYRA